MARYVDAIDLPIPVGEAFDFLADFSRTAEWDPGVESAERVGTGPIGEGSRFRVVVSFLGQRIPFEYVITEMQTPTRLVFVGESEAGRSIDEITFAPTPKGTRVTYEARLELSGMPRLADPILHALFQVVGRVAVRGLRERWASGGRPEPHARPAKRRSTRTVQPKTSRSKRTATGGGAASSAPQNEREKHGSEDREREGRGGDVVVEHG